VRVQVGEQVEAGQVLVVLEAMKMEHHITAAVAGTVTEVHVHPGSQVHTGDVLLVLEAHDEAQDGAPVEEATP
jgi:propionyl-CoA carboxylase alpha chain